MNKVVISLCDYTTEAAKPWAENGYDCYCFDSQHEDTIKISYGTGSITKVSGKIEDNFLFIVGLIKKGVAFAMAFPTCTDLAVSGAAHFDKKRKEDPDFQHKAMRFVSQSRSGC